MHRNSTRSQHTYQSPKELTDCKYFSEGKCQQKCINYRHNKEALKRAVCSKWEEGSCSDKNCLDRHPREFWNTKSNDDKTKKKKCFKYPHCPYGNTCKYWHPTQDFNVLISQASNSSRHNDQRQNRSNSQHIMCRDWPNCAYKERCRFKHPDPSVISTSNHDNNNNNQEVNNNTNNTNKPAVESLASANNLEELAETCKDMDINELQRELDNLTEQDVGQLNQQPHHSPQTPKTSSVI